MNGLTNVGVEFKESLVIYKTGIKGQHAYCSNAAYLEIAIRENLSLSSPDVRAPYCRGGFACR
jgi:hypothetical protein